MGEWRGVEPSGVERSRAESSGVESRRVDVLLEDPAGGRPSVVTLTSRCRGNAIKYPDMINKLKLVREIADEIWPGQP
jgi:hypothetical protein